MRCLIPLFIVCLGWSHGFSLKIPAPDFEITKNTISTGNGDYIQEPGMPRLPCKRLTLALPPGAMLKKIRFHGSREAVGIVKVPPVEPVIPMCGSPAVEQALRLQREAAKACYSSSNILPETNGRLLSKGGLRKYTLIHVDCYHFGYAPLTGTLYYAPEIEVKIDYELPAPGSDRMKSCERLKNDITFDAVAREMIYNWDDAKAWYGTTSPSTANGYYIILPSSLQGAVAQLAEYRQGQGHDVHIVTKEYIAATYTGVDLQHKIRKFLRDNVADIEFALLVGFSSDMPWRSLVPFNNDPSSPYGSPDYSPIPGDIYYAELTDPDELSWNSDGDAYYGEVYDGNFQPNGDDDPDFIADIHVGRIPFSTASRIAEICAKTIAFDSNRDLSYKTAALLTGSMYYFENENYSGQSRLDGADFTEELMDDGVLKRSNSIYLYEMDGINPSLHPCIDALTRANHISYWQKKGVMYECHHGSSSMYARKVWAWDDGDNVPEGGEIEWPTSLTTNDVYQLDNAFPATAFLRSCLCGKPENNCFGAMMLYRGASSVVCSSRVAWMSLSDPGGMPYHFYDRLLKRLPSSQGLVGKAHDLSKIDFMGNTGFWMPVYHYNLFGDPALRQLGRRYRIQPRPVGGIGP